MGNRITAGPIKNLVKPKEVNRLGFVTITDVNFPSEGVRKFSLDWEGDLNVDYTFGSNRRTRTASTNELSEALLRRGLYLADTSVGSVPVVYGIGDFKLEKIWSGDLYEDKERKKGFKIS